MAAMVSRALGGATAFNAATSSGGRLSGTALQIPFEFGSTALVGESQALLDQVAALAKKGAVELMIVARDTENFDPGKRDAMLDQRIAAVTAALASRGIPPGGIAVTWRPDQADTSIHRDGPGR